jgi:AcrR family transcriptional regulator
MNPLPISARIQPGHIPRSHLAKKGPLGQTCFTACQKARRDRGRVTENGVNIHLSDTLAPTRPARRNSERRRETENAIIDAFARLLVRDGVAGIGVNALVKEAGVGKKPLYDYFGGIAGVAVEWVQRRGIWPPLEEIVGEPLDAFMARKPGDKLRLINRQCAAMLRANPPLCELLSGEFVRSSEMKSAVEHVRQLVRLDFERVLKSDPVLSSEDYLALNTIAYAATTYLALRAHCQPRFFGFDLATETSWQMVMNMFDRVLDNAEAGIASRARQVD